MKKKIMSVILSAVLLSGVVAPVSTYGEDFYSEEAGTAEETETANSTESVESQEEESDWAAEETEDVISGFEDGGFSDAQDLQEIESTTDGEEEAFTQEENALDETEIWDDDELEVVEIDPMDASTSGFDSASKIYTNTTYSSNLTDSKRELWFKFSVPSNGNISFDFKHEYIESGWTYWMAVLYTGDHTELTVYDFAGNTTLYEKNKFGVAAGTYYLKINEYNFSDVNFRFRVNYEAADNWETEINDTYQQADSINVNGVYCGSLQNKGDVDWYKFVVPQNGYISIDFKHDYIEDGYAYWKIELYNEQYKKMELDDIPGSSVICNGEKCGVTSGTYYLKIYPWFWSDKKYEVKINYAASNVWETEFNDDYSSADLIKLNTTYYGSLQRGRTDVDWYKITIPTAGSYEFFFAHDYIESNSEYWAVKVYDNLFNEKGYFRYRGNNKIDSDKVELSSGGDYYIKISESSWSGIPYSFRISAHTHSYTNEVTQATLSKDGLITPKCSCGQTGLATVIYRPATTSLSKTAYTYNGKAQKPGVTVYDSKSKVISPANYTLSYDKDASSIGTHKVTIQFKGNYSGTTSRTYVINPKPTKIKKLSKLSKGFTAKWAKVKGVTGYQVQYSTSKKFTKSSTTTIGRQSTSSTKVRYLKGRKKYYVRVRTYKFTYNGGTYGTYYSSWSAAKAVTTKR